MSLLDHDQDFEKPEKKPPGRQKGDTKEKIALSPEQEAELLKLAYDTNTTHGLIIQLALNTSLRVNELCNLIIPNLCLEENKSFIKIADRPASTYSDSFTCKTAFSNRMNPLTNDLAKTIKMYLGNRKTGYVFQSQRKQNRDFPCFNPKSLINMINKYAKEAKSIGFCIGFHSTRRTFASKLIDRQVPINQISLALGHSDIQTTFRYLKQIRKLDMNLIREALANQ